MVVGAPVLSCKLNMYISTYCKYFNSKNFQSACSKHLLLLKVGDMLFAILVSDDA